jgi:5-hydroxyisourate hydrolase
VSVSTHVLDTARGLPATGVPVTLNHSGTDRRWSVVGRGVTDSDGRVRDLYAGPLAPGVYRLDFDTAHYFDSLGVVPFYPEVTVVFSISDPGERLHVPLLLSPFGYATYKGT